MWARPFQSGHIEPVQLFLFPSQVACGWCVCALNNFPLNFKYLQIFIVFVLCVRTEKCIFDWPQLVSECITYRDQEITKK